VLGYVERLHLLHVDDVGAVLDDSYELGEQRAISSTSLGDDRFFAITGPNYYYGYDAEDGCDDCGGGGIPTTSTTSTTPAVPPVELLYWAACKQVSSRWASSR